MVTFSGLTNIYKLKKWTSQFTTTDIIERLIYYDLIIATKQLSGSKINALLTVILKLRGL